MKTITGKLYQVNGGGNNPQVTYYLPNKREAGKEIQALLLEKGIKLSLKDCCELSNYCGINHINLLNHGWVEQRIPKDAVCEILENIVGDATDAVKAIQMYLA